MWARHPTRYLPLMPNCPVLYHLIVRKKSILVTVCCMKTDLRMSLQVNCCIQFSSGCRSEPISDKEPMGNTTEVVTRMRQTFQVNTQVVLGGGGNITEDPHGALCVFCERESVVSNPYLSLSLSACEVQTGSQECSSTSTCVETTSEDIGADAIQGICQFLQYLLNRVTSVSHLSWILMLMN